MFIRIWHKAENVGSDDPRIEEYVAIRYIMRFYSRRYEGEAETRYIIATGADNSYVTEETFEYLKSLRNRNHHERRRITLPDGPAAHPDDT